MREKLIELLRKTRYEYRRYIGMKDMEKRMAKTDEEFLAIDDSIVGEIPFCADHLIANGVTFAEDNNVPSKWIPASDPPKDTCEYWVAYQGGDGPCYTVGYFDGKHWRAASNTLAILPALYWMPILTLPEPPKGE